MRLLRVEKSGELTLTPDLVVPAGPYAILSHTWGPDEDEVTFEDVIEQTGAHKAGYAKLWFCANRARSDGLEYFWIDTCCINKANHVELSKAITSMFRWYRNAAKCYVYLSDVSLSYDKMTAGELWETEFWVSRWHRRGWTLQELLAPASVEFFAVGGELLCSKQSHESLLQDITNVPVEALRGTPLSTFSVDERFQWTRGRETKEPEDKAYCLLGIFGLSMSLRYGEGVNAFKRLTNKLKKISTLEQSGETSSPTTSGFSTSTTNAHPDTIPVSGRSRVEIRAMPLHLIQMFDEIVSFQGYWHRANILPVEVDKYNAFPPLSTEEYKTLRAGPEELVMLATAPKPDPRTATDDASPFQSSPPEHELLLKLAQFMIEYQDVLTAQLDLFPNLSQKRALFGVMLGMTRGSLGTDPGTCRTLLHWFSMNDVHGLIPKLVELGFDVNARDSDYRTPLHLAVISNNYFSVEALLEECNADANVEDLCYLLPWHLALAIDDDNVVENDERAYSKAEIISCLARYTDPAKVRGKRSKRILDQLREDPEAEIFFTLPRRRQDVKLSAK